jgi:copper chaperone CopZ
MGAMSTTSHRLEVRGLVDRPAVGTTCCVTTAEALVAQELWMLPGIVDATIDPRSGIVEVVIEPAHVSLDEIRQALSEIGYPAEVAA